MRFTKLASIGFAFFVATTPLFLSSCGSKSQATANNPAPSVTSLMPPSAPAGAAAQTLTINGSNFIASSTVTYNAVPHTATLVNSGELTIPLTAADQATGGSYAVVVTNPAPGGGTSSANFAVDNPVPDVTSLVPPSLTVGSAAQTLTINGTGFVAASTVTFNGNAVTATVVNSTTITIPLTVADLATVGTDPVVVTNATPGGGSSPFNFSVTAGNAIVGGVVFKSGVTGATVTFTAVNADGSNGATVATCQTDANGNFTCTLSPLPAGAVRACAAGGTYTSEFDGSTITSDSQICALIDQVPGTGLTGLAITPVSDFINSLAVGDLTSGKAATLAAAHAAATAQLDAFYSFTAGVQPETLTPKFTAADITGSPDAFKLGAVLSSYTLEGETLSPADPDALIAALSADISDGVWDGKSSGTPITMDAIRKTVTYRKVKAAAKPIPLDGTTTNLPPPAGTSDFVAALLQCLDQAASQTPPGQPVPIACLVYTTLTPQQLAAVYQAILTAVGASSSTPAYANVGPTSSAAVVAQIIGGTQYLFVATGPNGIAVYDFTNPNQPVMVNLWPQIAAVIGPSSSPQVTGLIPIGQSLMFAFSFYTMEGVLLDSSILVAGTPGTSDPVLLSGTLQLQNTVGVNFLYSPAPTFIEGGTYTGVSIYADTADGYYLFTPNLSQGTLSGILGTPQLFPVTDPNQQVGMQMAVDPLLNLILIGNSSGYSTPPGGAQLIELNQTPLTSYYWDDTTAASFPSPSVPEGIASPALSGTSIDTQYGVGILTYEDFPYVTFLNLSSGIATQPPGSGGYPTFTIPLAQTAQVTLATSTPVTAAGSFVDSKSHLALFMSGDASQFAVGAVQNPATVLSGSTWQGLSNWMFWDIYSSSSSFPYFTWDNEPFSAGIVTSMANNQPYGYIVDGSGQGVVQVSMTDFINITASGTSGDALHTPSTDPATTNTAPSTAPTVGPILQELYFSPDVVTAVTVSGPNVSGTPVPCSSSLTNPTCTVSNGATVQLTATLTLSSGATLNVNGTSTVTSPDGTTTYTVDWYISGGNDGTVTPTGAFTAGIYETTQVDMAVTLKVSYQIGTSQLFIEDIPIISVP